MSIDWKKPIEFTYHTSKNIKRPARLLIADKKGVESETHVIAVTVENTEHVYTVNACGCGAKGQVSNGKQKVKTKVVVYSYRSSATPAVYALDITKYGTLEAYFGQDHAHQYNIHEVIEREYEV